MSEDRENLMVDHCLDKDTFVCELSRIDRIGSNRRLIFTVPDATYPCKVIVAKLIVPADRMADMGLMIAGDEPMTQNYALRAFEPRGEAN